MSGSSEAAALREGGWLTTAELKIALRNQGVILTDRMIRDWRGEGLAPPVRQLQTPGDGSETFHPPRTLEQFIAAAAVKPRRYPLMRWELWWRGFPIEERYWREDLAAQLDRYERDLRVIRRALGFARLVARLKVAPGIGYRASAHVEDAAGGLLKGLRRVPLVERLGVVRTALEVAKGDFAGFTSRHEDRDLIASREAMLAAMGFSGAERNSIFGLKIEAGAVVEDAWRTLAALNLRRSFEIASSVDLIQARDDLWNLLQSLSDFYVAARWVYGPRAFGLRLASQLVTAAPYLRKFWIVSLVALRRSGFAVYSSEELRKMVAMAAASRDAVITIQRLADEKRFKDVLTASAFREAFTSNFAHAKLLKRIEVAAARR